MVFVALLYGCSGVNNNRVYPTFTFEVVGVGEGLSQIGVVGSSALVWDLGDTSVLDNWDHEYERLGTPRISAIVISHSHNGFPINRSRLSRLVAFSGLVITHPFEDTAYLRRTAGTQGPSLFFRTVAQGDTIAGLEGVRVECLWPPRTINETLPLADSLKDRYSLCFLVQYHDNSVLVTSDIDTIAQRNLGVAYSFNLASDIIVVPHQGKTDAVDEVFFGYVNPQSAIISCNRTDELSEKLIGLLYQMRVNAILTCKAGNSIAESNGYYWKYN